MGGTTGFLSPGGSSLPPYYSVPQYVKTTNFVSVRNDLGALTTGGQGSHGEKMPPVSRAGKDMVDELHKVGHGVAVFSQGVGQYVSALTFFLTCYF